jgi:cyclic lactone autoinducer peptide
MRKVKKYNLINMLGLCLISLASIITNTACLGFIGEVDPPKSLLDK